MAQEPLKVFACESEWAALAQEIGQQHVEVFAATSVHQDPHHIQARPSLIAKMRQADLLICTGADLEIGWLPMLLKKSANAKLRSGTNNYLMASEYVSLLDQQAQVDRSMGDVHAAGNPHFQLDPKRVVKVAKVLSQRLSTLDSTNSSSYEKNYLSFEAKINSFEKNYSGKIAQLKNKKVIVHHNSWIYLNQWLDLQQIATLEPIPGSPPSTNHLSKLLNAQYKADAIIYSFYQNPKAATWLSTKTNTPSVKIASTVDHWQEKDALLNWYKSIVDSLLKTLN